MWIRIQFWIQGFDDQKVKKFYSKKFLFLFFNKKLQFTYP